MFKMLDLVSTQVNMRGRKKSLRGSRRAHLYLMSTLVSTEANTKKEGMTTQKDECESRKAAQTVELATEGDAQTIERQD